MNYTDGIVLVLFILFFCHGWQKGFFLSILGPISLILATIVSYVYYRQSGNFFIALLIGIFGPFILKLILSMIFKMNKDPDQKDSALTTLGRCLGGLFQLSWQGVIVLLVILLIALVPTHFPWVAPVRDNIHRSRVYEIINGLTGHQLPGSDLDIQALQNTLKNPDTVKDIQETSSFQKLNAHPEIQVLLQDPELLKHIENQNIFALMKDERIQKLMENEDLLKNIFELQKEILSRAKK